MKNNTVKTNAMRILDSLSIEETALLEDTIFVSAGERGYQLLLKPEDLRKACDGTFADFV